MSEIQIAVTPSTGFRRLQVHGQAVVEMHRQLSTIVGNRLGRQHAQLLSRPEIDSNGGNIAWFSAPLGPVRKLAELAEAERQPIETLRRQLLAEIGQLARKMKREGDSAGLVAHMLEL